MSDSRSTQGLIDSPRGPAEELCDRDRLQVEATTAQAEKSSLDFAEQGTKAALDGRIDEARQAFARAMGNTTNMQVLFLAYDFYFRTGDLVTAEEIAQRCLDICGRNIETAETARALSHLGMICHERYELDQAKELYNKALAISLKLKDETGVARGFGTIGLVNSRQGNLDRAEKMLKRALTIHEKIGNEANIARDIGNIGSVYANRGELEQAEKMFEKALVINQAIDQRQCMATNYSNLGLVAHRRGDFDKARELWIKARDLSEKIGMVHMATKMQGLLNRSQGSRIAVSETMVEMTTAKGLDEA